MNECILRDDKAKIITIAPPDLTIRYLKHECPDGTYSVEGAGYDCVVYRHQGILYPSAGVFGAEKRFPPRTLEECIEFFGDGSSNDRRPT